MFDSEAKELVKDERLLKVEKILKENGVSKVVARYPVKNILADNSMIPDVPISIDVMHALMDCLGDDTEYTGAVFYAVPIKNLDKYYVFYDNGKFYGRNLYAN